MADNNPIPIALQGRGVTFDDALRPISGILGIQAQQQNIQNAQLSNQRGQVDLQQSQQDLKERQGAIGVLQNISKYQSPNGDLDSNRLTSDLLSVAPTNGAAMAQQAIQTHQAATAAKSAVNSLDATTRTQGGAIVQAISGMDPIQGLQALSDFAKQNPQLAAPIDFLGRNILAPAYKSGDPQAWQNALNLSGRMFLSAGDQQTIQTPTGPIISNGAQSQMTNTKPYASVPQGQAVPGTSAVQVVAPSQREEIKTDAFGRPYVEATAPDGTKSTHALTTATSISDTTAPNRNGGPTDPGITGKEEAQGHMAAIQAARAVAEQAPIAHDINRTIIAALDNGTATGKLGELTQKLASATGYKLSTNEATDYNLLGKMLERNAINTAHSMGMQTNAGLEAQIKANGSLDYTPKALRTMALLNDALTYGAERRRDGLNAALLASGNNPMIKPAFDQAWSQNFDPIAARAANAIASKGADVRSNPELAEIQKEVGGWDSKAGKELRGKLANLSRLSTLGHL